MTRLSLSAVTLALLGALTAGIAAQDQVYRAGDGVTMPVVVKEVKPTYTKAAMDAKIEGTVWLETIVQADGKVGTVQVTKSLDTEFGLDEQAIKAAKQWEFTPGSKDGKPVAVEITLEMTFTLKKR